MGDGGYAPIAEALFNRCDVDAFLLEYDLPRAGDFSPLRHLPAGKRAYLGIISTKNPTLETAEDLLRRLDEAGRFAPMERLAFAHMRLCQRRDVEIRSQAEQADA